MKIEWTDRALKDLEDLENHIAQRIIDKVEDACDFPDHYLSPLKGYALHKIRIGDYLPYAASIVTLSHNKAPNPPKLIYIIKHIPK